MQTFPATSFLRRSRERFSGVFLAEADAARVRVFECLFAFSFLLWMARSVTTWREWLTAEGFHLEAVELQSMGYPEPWPLLQAWQIPLLMFVILGGAILLATLRWRRLGLVLLFLAAVSVQRIDFMAAFTLNKLYVAVFALLALAPGIVRHSVGGYATQSLAPLRILQATLILQYFAAGLAKVEGDWLGHHDLLWGYVQGVYRTDAAAWALRTFPGWAWTVQQYISLGFELLAPLLFVVRRLRPLAFVLGFGFHFLIAILMKDLVFFSFQMAAFYALFIPSSTWRSWLVQFAWRPGRK